MNAITSPHNHYRRKITVNIKEVNKQVMRKFSSVQSLSHVWLFATAWTAACQASLSISNSKSLLKLMSVELVIPSNHLILCHPLLLPSIFPSIRVFSNESNSTFRKLRSWHLGPITSWQIDGETIETVTYFINLVSKITADGDCSHEIKRCLLLGRKAITNLDSILKSRDITLLTKICLVKAVVFPVGMHECDSWTIKKAEHWRIDAFELWCWRRLLRVPWTARKSSQSILKEISPKYSLEGLMLKLELQYFGHLRRNDSFEKVLIKTQFPPQSVSPIRKFPSLLSFSLRGQTEWKPQSQKTVQTDHMDHNLV